MMSQLLSQSGDLIYASISIAKFSHNTCPNGTRNFVWSHVANRNDLDLIVRRSRVVDEYGNFNERLVMKIVAGAELLENQDLGQLVNFSQQFDPLTGDEHPVQVVVKCPFLAMRYPKTANNIRRLQVKFHNESDFSKALNMLQEIGLPISESAPPTQPSTVQIPSPAPSTFSDFAMSSRPASANIPSTPASSISGPPSRPTSKTDFRVPTRPDSSNSEAARPVSSMSYSKPSIPRSASISSAFSVAKHSAPPVYSSQIEKESQSQQISLSEFPQGPNPKYPIFPFELKPSQHAVIPEETNSASGVVSPFFPSKGQEMQFEGFSPGASTMADPFIENNIPRNNLARPSSTPIVHKFDNFAPSHGGPFLASKPLPKPRAASVSILPPLPKPTPVARIQSKLKLSPVSEAQPTPTQEAPKKRVAQRKSTNVTSKLDESATSEGTQTADLTKRPVVFEQPAEPEDEPSPLAAKSAAATARPASAMASLQTKAAPVKKRAAAPIRPASAAKRPKMVDQGTQTQTLSGRDHTVALKATPANENLADVPALVNDTQSPPSPPESYLNTIDNFVTKHKARPAPKELWQTPEYAEADEERRMLLINDFICDNLDNDDFLQLCQDTEKAWRRIGLGM